MTNYNYKPVLDKFGEDELRKLAAEKAKYITIRKYYDANGNEAPDGTSEDVKRLATKREKEIITNLIYGALLAIRWRNDSAQVAMDTAEFTAVLFIDGINGYISVYSPIWYILETLRERVETGYKSPVLH